MEQLGAPAFENLTEDQQTEVLRYLEATNTDDVEEATRVLHGFKFNSTQAISHRFGGGSAAHSDRSHQHAQREPTIEQQRQLGQYIRHLQLVLRQRTIWRILSQVAKATAKSLLRKLGGLLLPNCIRERLLLSKFDRMHAHVSGVNFQSTTLQQVLQKGRYNEKPCLLFISPPDRTDRTMLHLIGQTETLSILNSRFMCYGTTWDSQELQQLEQPIEPSRVQIVAVYFTIMDKARHLKTFILDEKDPPLTTKLFEEVITRYRSERKHEKNILIRYNNMVLAHYHDEAATELMEQEIPEDEVHYEDERRLVEEQQKEYEMAMRQSKIAQERRQKQQQEQRRRDEQLENLKEQRKVRKMSIPDEPQEGDIIKLHFRCPDGTKVVRNFPKDEHLELVYHWVETNDDIQFEDDSRRFELLAGYPPQPLSDKMQSRIASVFQDDLEQIQIKEL